MNNFEYYVIDRKGDKAYPLVSTQAEHPHTMMYIRTKEEITDPQKTYFQFCAPIPRQPVIGDYFSQSESIVSEKIKNVLEPMKIKGIQLIPAEVMSDKGDTYKDYYYIHIFNYIKAVDRKKSIYTESEYYKDMLSIDAFSLDITTLEKIPLEERLIFKLIEDSTISLYHKSIVEAIMAVNPEGVQFTRVEDWEF